MRRLIVLVVAIMLVSLTGCGKFEDIKVNYVKPVNVFPHGFKGANVELAVEIDNPAVQIQLSDMEAVLKHSGKIIGKVTVDPFTMKGRTVETYYLMARVTYAQGLSLKEIWSMIDKNFLDKCYVDITVTGKLKCGISKTIKKNGIPLKKLMNHAKK
jgi:hypothetical protein